jgi:hypothetical protein
MKKRPPLDWKRLWIMPFLIVLPVLLAVDGRVWLAVGGVILMLALFFVPWLLSPYSKVARRIYWPTDEDYDRGVRVANRLGSLPVFGVIWRFAERLSGNAGRRYSQERQRWQHEHDDWSK